MSAFWTRIFRKENQEAVEALKVDMHSHLLPGIDDGVEDFEQAYQTILDLKNIGFEKLITTPHMMMGVYDNTPEMILAKRDALRAFLLEKNLDIQLEASAEYYLDEHFMELVKDKEKLLPIAGQYILIETAFMHASPFLNEAVFLIQASGLKPILAHPERYLYMHENFNQYIDLHDKGVLFQVNLSSLTGYYSPMVRKVARKLIDEHMVDFLGTDCHGPRHIDNLKKSFIDPYYKKAVNLPLLNKRLLS
jgi:protein-tyrosine phosphatase